MENYRVTPHPTIRTYHQGRGWQFSKDAGRAAVFAPSLGFHGKPIFASSEAAS
jgi:hypothetical protein